MKISTNKEKILLEKKSLLWRSLMLTVVSNCSHGDRKDSITFWSRQSLSHLFVVCLLEEGDTP